MLARKRSSEGRSTSARSGVRLVRAAATRAALIAAARRRFAQAGYHATGTNDLVALAGGPDHVVTIADYAGAAELGVTVSGGMGAARALYALKMATEMIEAGRFSLPIRQTARPICGRS